MKQTYHISGMSCSACAAHIEAAVGKLDGLESVAVNLLRNSMTVSYGETLLRPADILRAVEAAGYSAAPEAETTGQTPASPAAPVENARNDAKQTLRRLYWSAGFLLPLLYLSMGHMLGLPLPAFLHGETNAVTFALAQLVLTLAILFLNRLYFERGFRTLLRGKPTMDSLIAIGSSAAVLYGFYALTRIGQALAVQNFALVGQYTMDLYFESAGTILTLITAGKYLEGRSKGRTGEAIERLIRLAPKTALVEREGIQTEIPAEQVQIGDILVVKSGSAIPVDGVVTEGGGAVDESAISGESLPVEKTAGDTVIGGTLSRSGFFKMRATRVGSDTTLAQIVRLVEEAGAGKAPIARLADKVSAVFVPVVIAIAVLAAVIWLLLGQSPDFALSIGIAVLVISCPCALGLATPTAILVGSGRAAQLGILFKNAESLETAHKATVAVLDKTGTLTEGKPSVMGVFPAEGLDEEALLAIAAAAEGLSEHPLAEAVVAHARERQVIFLEARDLRQMPGRGIQAELDGDTVLAGNAALMAEHGIGLEDLDPQAERAAQEGQTPLYFAMNDRLLGMICLADAIKPSSAGAVQALRKEGLEVVLLTGDNPRTAEAVARQLGISTVIAGVLPQEKEAKIRELQAQGKRVLMVGDGVNDAPALTRADCGIAIGAGTEIAMESADVVLMHSDLMDVALALRLSRATLRNIKQNLFWAFFYNSAGIPLAAGLLYSTLGWKLNPMFAAAAMSLSSLFVVTNALRLRRWAPGDKTQEAGGKTWKPEKQTEMPTEPQNGTVGEEIQTEPQDLCERTDTDSMTKQIKIEGMSCANCKAHVERALNALEGVSATVDLEAQTAAVTLEQPVEDAALEAAVTQAGYVVVEIM